MVLLNELTELDDNQYLILKLFDSAMIQERIVLSLAWCSVQQGVELALHNW